MARGGSKLVRSEGTFLLPGMMAVWVAWVWAAVPPPERERLAEGDRLQTMSATRMRSLERLLTQKVSDGSVSHLETIRKNRMKERRIWGWFQKEMFI